MFVFRKIFWKHDMKSWNSELCQRMNFPSLTISKIIIVVSTTLNDVKKPHQRLTACLNTVILVLVRGFYIYHYLCLQRNIALHICHNVSIGIGWYLHWKFGVGQYQDINFFKKRQILGIARHCHDDDYKNENVLEEHTIGWSFGVVNLDVKHSQ